VTGRETLENARPSNRKVNALYASIALGITTTWSILNGWLVYFYLPPEGEGSPLVPAAFYGLAILVNRVIDGIVDPPIGYLSDHVRSRWGRRRPLMFGAALPMLVFFVLLWTPPVQGRSIWNLVYLAVTLELYNIAYSFLNIPYGALLPELALTDRHRVRISAWVAGFQTVGMILSSFAGVFIEKWGYANAALAYALLMVPVFYIPILVLRERPGRQIAVAERLNFWKSLSIMLQNRAFRVYTITWALYWSTMTLIPAVIPFIATEICLATKSETVYFYLPTVLASLICYPLITWLSSRVGTRRLYTVSLLASAIASFGLLLVGEWIPVGLEVQGIIWVIAGAVTLSGVVVLSPTFAAQITDYDSELTGQRREGVFYAAWGLLDNTVSGVATALVPIVLLLGRSRSSPHGPLGVRMMGVIAGIMMLIAFFVFQRYPSPHHGEDGQPPGSGYSPV
jgi:GPH family glycoside/pentoside/hexuronide:cation symporter